MERGSKNKFKMKSAPLRAEETIAGRFMAMGRSLGNSKTSNPVAIDPSKYYKAPKKTDSKVKEINKKTGKGYIDTFKESSKNAMMNQQLALENKPDTKLKTISLNRPVPVIKPR